MTSTSSHDERESNSLAEKRRPLRKRAAILFWNLASLVAGEFV
jgi:hypothetical protein